jgi:two-component system sensor histidine kinase BaeS
VVLGDPLQLKQALRNLASNAVKYSPRGASIELSAVDDGQSLALRVRDTGSGIAAEDLPFIFDRFYRVRNQSTRGIEGNGLGLAIVKSIAERHGGQVGVESQPGVGSCFTFLLPLETRGVSSASGMNIDFQSNQDQAKEKGHHVQQ